MKKTQNTGQALVMLLFYMVIIITLTTTAVALTLNNSLSAMREEEGGHALEIAESGVENALLRLLRNPEYTGETMDLENGSAHVVVADAGVEKMITSRGVTSGYSRNVLVMISIQNGIISIVSWKEL